MTVYRIPTHNNYHKNGSLVFKKPRHPEHKLVITRYRLVMACLLAFLSVLVIVKLTTNSIGPERAAPAGLGAAVPASGTAVEITQLALQPEAPTVSSQISALFRSNSEDATFQWYRNGIELKGETAMTLAPLELRKGDEITFTVYTGDQEESVSAVIENSLPGVQSVRLNPESIHRGVDITAEAVGFDADDDFLDFTYRWIINGDEDTVNTGSVYPGDSIRRGDKVSVIVTAHDNEGSGKDFVSVPVVIPNAAPTIVSTPPSEYEAGRFSYRVSAVDEDGDKINFSLGDAPVGMTIDSVGLISWTFNDMETSVHDVEVIAIDSEGLSSSQIFSLSIEGAGDEGN